MTGIDFIRSLGLNFEFALERLPSIGEFRGDSPLAALLVKNDILEAVSSLLSAFSAAFLLRDRLASGVENPFPAFKSDSDALRVSRP